MRFRIETSPLSGLPDSARTSVWIAFVTGSSVVFSLALACATPFPALATVAGIWMSRRDALTLVGVAWLVNQSIGYLVLGYPQTWDSFAWGGAIGIAAALAALVVTECARRLGATFKIIALAFVTAFAVYEATLVAATTILPSSMEAFSLSVVSWIFCVNLLALAGLVGMYRAAIAMRLLDHPQPLPQVIAHS